MAQVLRPLRDHPAFSSPHLLVGVETRDDAGAYRLPDGRVLIQTVDFFTPVVDDPADWGRVAAANALSDVYAMGGKPLTALQLVCWPSGTLPLETLTTVVQGGSEVMARAGCTVVGGHTVDDPEPKYGFSVTGTAVRLTTNAGARPGDLLVLTKPLGTGIITTAHKAGGCPPDVLSTAVASMVSLNDRASHAMISAGASAATDVTGYGLAGHLLSMLDASGAAARVEVSRLPLLRGTRELLSEGFYPGGSLRNLEAFDARLGGGDEAARRLVCDAQTSGGLLVAVTPSGAGELTGRLREDGVSAVAIGEVIEGRPSVELA